MGKINCEACRKSCKGQAIKLQERYFHLKCFKCEECKKPLATGGFYTKNELHYCVEDYQRLFGVKCHACGEFVEGEVVTALGNTYHEGCFHCSKCSKKFEPGDKVTFSHKDYLCNSCMSHKWSPASATPDDMERAKAMPLTHEDQRTSPPLKGSVSAPCTPAKQENSLIDGHMSTSALDYSSDASRHVENGITVVIEVTPGTNTSGYKSETSFGRNTPASRFSDVFDGSYTDGHCNGDESQQESDVFMEMNGVHSYYGRRGRGGRSRLSPIQNIMRYRSISPGSAYSEASRRSKESTGSFGSRFDSNFGKFLKTSYLEKLADYKRGPSINPHQNEKSPKHYHRPENFSYSKVRRDFIKPPKKGLLTALGDQEYVTSLKKMEPYKPIKTQEPIQLSKIPDAQKCDSHVAPIERDDWPAPPAPAAAYPDLLREHRLLRKSSDAVDGLVEDREENVDPKIERDIQELSKMTDSGAAKVILEDLRKIKTDGVMLDPRSASRVPSAANEPPYKTRYESSVFASPSRDLDQRLRLQSLDCLIERKYRTSTLPISNFPVPRPGYSLTVRSSAMDGRNRYSFEGIDVSQPRRPDSSAAVLQRSSYYSSQSSVDDYDPTTGLRKNPRLRSSTVSEGFMSPYFGYRRSVPSLFKVEEPPKIYTYEQLKQFYGKLPPDVSRDTIEQHLSQDEFESLFGMSRDEFYRLAEWKRNDIKTRLGLF